ncbi:MAG: c-type cytochrome [Myxococcota bacterium]
MTFSPPALAQGAAPSGEQIFALCSQCHGSQGEGSAAYAAPPIAGMEQWYLAKQLRKYKSGARGNHASDHEGLKMRPMVRFLKTDEWVDNVAAYVAELPPKAPQATLVGGDAERGKGLYAPCAACHGQAGEGVEATNGAPLAGLSDWYLYSSIEKFKSGIRGSDPADTDGAVMRGMAMILTDDQALKDVIAHIMTFPN